MKGLNRVALILALLVVCGSSAQAGFIYKYATNVNPTATPSINHEPNNSFTETFSIQGYLFIVSGTRSAPAGNDGFLTLGVTVVRNLGFDTDTPLDSITFSLTSSGFQGPDGTRTLTGLFSSTPAVTAVNLTSAIGRYDLGNNDYGVSGVNEVKPTNTLIGVGNAGAPFSLTDEFTLTNLSGMALSDIYTINITSNVDASDAPVASAPAPPAMLLGLFGIPAFALVRRFTRKSGGVTEVEPTVAA